MQNVAWPATSLWPVLAPSPPPPIKSRVAASLLITVEGGLAHSEEPRTKGSKQRQNHPGLFLTRAMSPPLVYPSTLASSSPMLTACALSSASSCIITNTVKGACGLVCMSTLAGVRVARLSPKTMGFQGMSVCRRWTLGYSPPWDRRLGSFRLTSLLLLAKPVAKPVAKAFDITGARGFRRMNWNKVRYMQPNFDHALENPAALSVISR